MPPPETPAPEVTAVSAVSVDRVVMSADRLVVLATHCGMLLKTSRLLGTIVRRIKREAARAEGGVRAGGRRGRVEAADGREWGAIGVNLSTLIVWLDREPAFSRAVDFDHGSCQELDLRHRATHRKRIGISLRQDPRNQAATA